MKMADMKLPKKSKEQLKTEMSPVEAERDRWPYGLQLRFESEQVDKLPHLKSLKIGQKVVVQAVGEVTELRMSERKEGKEDWTIEVQLQDVGCESKKKEESGSMMDAMKNVKEKRRL